MLYSRLYLENRTKDIYLDMGKQYRVVSSAQSLEQIFFSLLLTFKAAITRKVRQKRWQLVYSWRHRFTRDRLLVYHQEAGLKKMQVNWQLVGECRTFRAASLGGKGGNREKTHRWLPECSASSVITALKNSRHFSQGSCALNLALCERLGSCPDFSLWKLVCSTH